jgi:hypothetical protein
MDQMALPYLRQPKGFIRRNRNSDLRLKNFSKQVSKYLNKEVLDIRRSRVQLRIGRGRSLTFEILQLNPELIVMEQTGFDLLLKKSG